MVSKKTRTRNDISQLNMTGDDAIVLGSNSCFALPAAVPNIPMMSELRLVPHSCSLVQATANCADPILATPAGLQILGGPGIPAAAAESSTRPQNPLQAAELLHLITLHLCTTYWSASSS